jgi:hypothetical protein
MNTYKADDSRQDSIFAALRLARSGTDLAALLTGNLQIHELERAIGEARAALQALTVFADQCRKPIKHESAELTEAQRSLRGAMEILNKIPKRERKTK